MTITSTPPARAAVATDAQVSGTSRRRTAPHSLVSVVVATGVVVAAWLAWFPLTTADALTALTAAYATSRLVQMTLRRVVQPVALCFWIFVLVYGCVAPAEQMAVGLLPWHDSDVSGYYAPAQFMMLVAAASFEAAYTAPPVRRQRRPQARRGPSGATGSLAPRLVALLLVTALLTALSVRYAAGLGARFTSRHVFDIANATSGTTALQTGLLDVLPAAASTVGIGAAILGLRSDRRRRGTYLALLLAFLLLAVVTTNPLFQTRNIFLGAVATVVLVITVALRRYVRVLPGAFLIGFIFIYPWIDRFRYGTGSGRSLRSGLTTIDFDGFQQTCNALYYVRTQGIAWGVHLVSAVLFFVPRNVWHAKAAPASFAVAAARGYQFQNLSLPLWSELYVDLWWPGVVVGMWLLGRATRYLDRGVDETFSDHGILLACVTAGALFGFLRGPLGAQALIFFTAVALAAAATPARATPETTPQR